MIVQAHQPRSVSAIGELRGERNSFRLLLVLVLVLEWADASRVDLDLGGMKRRMSVVVDMGLCIVLRMMRGLGGVQSRLWRRLSSSSSQGKGGRGGSRGKEPVPGWRIPSLL